MGNQKKGRGFFRRLLNYMVFIVVSIFLVNGVTEFTYATDQVPNVIIDIKDRQIIQEGNLYGDDLWYPGNEVSGIIRINNNDITPCVINSLGIDVNMTTNSGMVYNSFLDNMKLTIEKGSLLSFNNTLADKKSLADLCDNGIKLKGPEQLIITKNNPLDLKYTLLMDVDSGNELQNVTATIDFLINVSGEETAVGDGSSSNNNSRNHSSTTNNTTEPDEEVTPMLPIVIEKVGLEDERFLKIGFPLPEEDDVRITEERNIGLKITTMLEDEEQEQVIATCILGEGNNVLILDETNYLINFNIKEQQFEPNVTYTAFVYDLDTGEQLFEQVDFIVDTSSSTQWLNNKIQNTLQ